MDDDPSVLRALARLLAAEGFETRAHAGAEAFLAALRPDEAGCAIIDLGLPDIGGLELQARLAALDPALPVVVLTGQGDIPLSVRAMKAGALDFLTKPVDAPALLAALRQALEHRARAHAARLASDEQHALLARLSPREAEVLAGVARGLLNKEIAAALGIAEKTVKIHRAGGLEKLGVRSVPALMAYASRLPAFPETAPAASDEAR